MRLITLSDKFYDEYGDFQEILQKRNRPYVCLEITINNQTFAIPFRHHIRHKYAFFTYDQCGLDYTKAVVIVDDSYISNVEPQIEQSEFNALTGMEFRIEKGMTDYIKLYKKAVQYRTSRHYANILRYSSLKYFENLL